ncbi:SMU1112c/YaeR family gloxylase I-like metalloprotein [Sphingobacterium sp. SYP-B4668]|uniref:SMU1112c/YaeR family gloxylase I-like metalloprotein n=1 Tax=Sphingobacterium sp. SYP-B4668 TaxID=2996035 RepID=UPI0022DE4694|nr:VOC family protein [Sphingobacterium sp. SYP-B4668]
MSLTLSELHHVAIICSDYTVSKHFYTTILGLEIIQETYRAERQSYKLDLAINGLYVIELFSFPSPPERVTNPEACGLRHLSFLVEDIEHEIQKLDRYQVAHGPIRVDELTEKRFVFFNDPDQLPIELYER